MNLGFIGTGKIASSIIYGIFKSKLKINKIYISSRNVNIAKKLNNKFSKIKVFSNNQEIIDKSNVIFLSVTPAVGNRILNELNFNNKKIIISLISTIKLKKLKKLTKSKNICKAIPLPFIENLDGPIIISPKNKTAKRIFSKLGYEIYNSTKNWLKQKGLKDRVATDYVAELFLALSKDAFVKKKIGFKKLVAESQTPKGLNMQVLNELKKVGFYDKFKQSLENVHKRIKK